MKWIILLCVPFVAGCRMTKFVKEKDVALESHVIKVVTADRAVNCQQDCLDVPLCFYINVHAQKLPSGRVTCDLNNSSKTADPDDLVARAGYQYHQMVEVEHCTVDRCIYKNALPDGWFVFGSKKVKIFPERKTWGRAWNYCHSIGGELVTIDSEDKNDFVTHLLDQYITNATTDLNSSLVMAYWTLDRNGSDVRLIKGSAYKEEDGVQSLYLSGSGAYATTPAVDFELSSFTIASWVKLQSSVNYNHRVSPLYGDWSRPRKFLIQVRLIDYKNLLLMGKNDRGETEPKILARVPPFDKLFHVAAAWDRNSNEAYVLLDGQKVGTEAQPSGLYLRNNSHTVYDIGLKRDSGRTLKGYMRDLMTIGKAITSEELGYITDPSYESFSGAWIGLNDVASEGDFHWSDGSHVTYAKWASNQPDNQNGYQNCVEVAVDGGSWADTNCGRQLPFICEKGK